MIYRALALFSGGLDSMLAVKTVAQMGIVIEGIVFETPFFSAQRARTSAKKIGLPLTVIDLTDTHLRMLRAPRYGYGKNMNPCIDCHTLMLKEAGACMEQRGADFIMTGEVLGQRPMSQTKQSLLLVAKNSGYGDFILRPLSAQLLPVTKPERDGIVDRAGLLAIQGRSRKTQMELARYYGINEYEPPAGGCLLTDPNFSRRLRDLFKYKPECESRDIELLKIGRHFRTPNGVKVIVGRDRRDNDAIQPLIRTDDWVIHMVDKAGPTVLIPNGGDEAALAIAKGLCVLYSGLSPEEAGRVMYSRGGQKEIGIEKALSQKEARAMLV